MRRIMLVALLVTVASGLAGCNAGRWLLAKVTPPPIDTERPTLPAELSRPAVLNFSKTGGYRHEEAIPACTGVLEEITSRRGWSIYSTENGAVMNPEDLARFDVVVWNNVSDVVLSEEQEANFREWMEQGGGFVGIHNTVSTKDSQSDWFLDELVRALFIGHIMDPQFQDARMVIEDRDHPATKHLGEDWVRSDEWYSFEESPRDKGAHVLAVLDEESYSPTMNLPWPIPDRDLTMGDHPVVWSHCIGRGRAFNSALGHKGEHYDEPDHQKMIEGAVAWAARVEGTGCDEVAAR